MQNRGSYTCRNTSIKITLETPEIECLTVSMNVLGISEKDCHFMGSDEVEKKKQISAKRLKV
jgi:hypothetical protein